MKGTMLKFAVAAGVGVLAVALSETAQAATLVGDTIQFDFLAPNQTNSVFSRSTTVTADSSDEFPVELLSESNPTNVFVFNPGERGFSLPRFLSDATFSPLPFNGFTLSSLDFDDGSVISGFTLDTNLAGLDASRISFTGNTFTVNLQGLSFFSFNPDFPGRNTYVNVGFQTTDSQTTPVPTPALLPGLAAMGIAALRRKRQTDTAE